MRTENKKEKFETLLILTEHGLRLVDTNHPCAKDINVFADYLIIDKPKDK